MSVLVVVDNILKRKPQKSWKVNDRKGLGSLLFIQSQSSYFDGYQ
ncbi:unnamed protein product [Paramecium sonneborni]|uniref:Uncharacterized protein n=1 Tax=Paramecium sonneborni TaxID=65129 RepID=A0A8S1RNJ3_9CILI|nr:unnamed protein product [Paramecium sonneborni]